MANVAIHLKPVAGAPPLAPTTTLFDLVAAVSDYAHSEAEVIATVSHLINSGRVRLVENFQGPDVAAH